MSLLVSPRFLRNVLLIDAATGLGSGAFQLGAPAWLAAWTGLPPTLLLESGIFLLLFGSGLVWLARRDPIPVAGVSWLVASNLAWAAACIALMLGPWIDPTPWGQAYLALHVVTVLVLAQRQWIGLRQLRSPRLSAA